MKSALITILLAALFLGNTSFAQNKYYEDQDKEIRCFMLNKWNKEQAERARDGSDIGNLYSAIFDFNTITRVGNVQVTNEIKDKVAKVDREYAELKAGTLNGVKLSSSVKKEEIRTRFYAMHNLNRSMMLAADRNFPECNLMAKPVAATTAQQSKSKATSSSRSGALQ